MYNYSVDSINFKRIQTISAISGGYKRSAKQARCLLSCLINIKHLTTVDLVYYGVNSIRLYMLYLVDSALSFFYSA